MNFKITSGESTDKWLPKNFRKCTFPILKQPAKTSDDISGSSFLLHYQDIPYIVTAAHVIDTTNPVIAFSTKSREIVGLKTSELQNTGLNWIKHPAGLDLAAIPFHMPLKLVNNLDTFLITENIWSAHEKISINDDVAHLGYPLQGTSNYADGMKSAFPQGMPGHITQIESLKIITETAAAHGASGGPMFLKKSDGTPHLIGVVIKTKVMGTPTKLEKYLNETSSLPISLVKDILELEEMKKQYENKKIPDNWW